MRICKLTTDEGFARDCMTVYGVYPRGQSVTVFASAGTGPTVRVGLDRRYEEAGGVVYLTLEQVDELITALGQAKRQAPDYFKARNPTA